jgi:hypothetical protein
MRLLLLSLSLVAWGLPVGVESSVPARRSESVLLPVAEGALAELQRAIGSTATAKPATAAGGQPQEMVFGKTKGSVTETAAGVRVLLSSGKTVQLKNVRVKNDETSDVTYTYRGSEPKTGLVWVKKSPYECPTQLLVSRASGRVTDIGSEPHLNAAGTLLFARQNECFVIFDDYYHPGFQLWRVQTGQLQLLKQVRLTNYFVLDGRWLGPDKLRLELGSMEELMSKGNFKKVRRLPFELTVK